MHAIQSAWGAGIHARKREEGGCSKSREGESPVTESLKGRMEELVLCSVGNEPLEGFQIEE